MLVFENLLCKLGVKAFKSALGLILPCWNQTKVFSFKTFVDSRYNIQRIKGMWELMMKNLLDEYKEKESRGKPSEVFVYDSQW